MRQVLNRCEFIGNLARDPEVRSTQSGARVVNLTLAVSEKFKDASGERQERTEWVRVTIWNEKLGEVAERYLLKGKQCFISGALQTRKWTDQSGVEKYSTEIVLQKFRGELVLLGGGQERPEPPIGYRSSERQAPQDELDSEIPF